VTRLESPPSPVYKEEGLFRSAAWSSRGQRLPRMLPGLHKGGSANLRMIWGLGRGVISSKVLSSLPDLDALELRPCGNLNGPSV
jgi:hypothetical protein